MASSNSAYSVGQLELKLQQIAAQNTQKTFDFNKQEATTARNWQEKMSNSSHQREVKDLKLAGLNPVLSANQGAASYTTSAASGSADSAVNALGNIGSTRIASDANLQSARISAAATRYAAQQSAAAQLAAARESAAASRYAASMNYAAQKYAVDFTKTGNAVGYATSWMNRILSGNRLGKEHEVAGSIKNVAHQLRSISPSRLFQNPSSVTKNNFKLSDYGYDKIRSQVSRLGVNPTKAVVNTFVKSFYFKDSSATRQMANYIDAGFATRRVSRATQLTLRRVRW